jgi:flagellar FliL protein
MSAKPDPKEAAPAVPDKPAPPAEKGAPGAEKAPAEAVAAPGGSKLGLFAAIGAVVLAPALSFAVAQFVLLPRLQKQLAAPAESTAAAASSPADAAAEPAAGKEGDKKGKAPPPTYEFTNVVVNLAGTMGTRYLKTSFIVTGTDAGLAALFESNKAKLTDVTLNVLSALTLADLEEPGSKNVLREKLVGAYNEAFGRKVADQVYFSDFVVQ